MTKYTIQHAKNGWILTAKYEDEPKSFIVGREADGTEIECFVDFLRDIIEQYRPSDDGRYGGKRIRVITIPGDKFSGELSKEYKEELQDLRDYLNATLEDVK